MKIEKVETPKRKKIFLRKPQIWFNRNLEEVCCLFRRLIKLAIWATKNGFGPQALRAYKTDYWLLQNLVESEILQFTLGIQITSICAHSDQELVKTVNAFWKLSSCKIQEITRETIWSTIKLMEAYRSPSKVSEARIQYDPHKKVSICTNTETSSHDVYQWVKTRILIRYSNGINAHYCLHIELLQKRIPNQSNKHRHQGPKLFAIIKS